MAARTLLAALLGSAAQAGYVPTFSDKFSDLSNWQLVVEGGSDTGNNELEVCSWWLIVIWMSAHCRDTK